MAEVKRHPIRGLLGGLVLGIGVSLLLFSYAKVAFGSSIFLILIGAVMLVGLVFPLVVPTAIGKKKGDGPPPPPLSDLSSDPSSEPAA
jgi:hypothetical protein